jgi:hypothetical protein
MSEEEVLEAFAEQHGLDYEAVAFLHEVPPEVQAEIIENFNSRGSKDGNVVGRLEGYARHLCRRNQLAYPSALANAPPPKERERASDNGHYSSSRRRGHEVDNDPLSVLPDFAANVGLTDAAEHFLSKLPLEVLDKLLRGFDPSNSKDGNVWGRLLGYARSLWANHLGLDKDSASYVRSLPEEIQLVVMMEFDGNGARDGNLRPRLDSFINFVQRRGTPLSGHEHMMEELGQEYDDVREFAHRMNLDRQATKFIQSLPSEISAIVVKHFNPSGTKDGNVWGRLLGYVRHIWCDHRGVDQATIRGMPEEEQMRAMSNPTASYSRGSSQSVWQFAKQWSLNREAEAFVGALPEFVRDAVVSGFDGSGSADGNLWGRLLGYTRQMWTRSLGLDSETTARLKNLPEEAQMLCMTSFDPRTTTDGNISARLEGFMNKCQRQIEDRDSYESREDYGRRRDDDDGRRRDDHGRRRDDYSRGRDDYGKGKGRNDYGKGKGKGKGRNDYGDRGGGKGDRGGGKGDRGGNPYAQPARAGNRSVDDLLEDPDVSEFLEKCGLGTETAEYLARLEEDIMLHVMRDFDHTGTKDGNVLGRLQGFARSLCRRRGLPVPDDEEGGPRKRMRT